MNTFLRSFSLLLALGLLAASPARASHAVGGDLTYRSLGNNRYEVNETFFRDCSGIAAPSSVTLTCRNNTFCNVIGAITATMAQVGVPIVNSPYCPAIQATINCTPTNPSPPTNPVSYLMMRYQATVTLPPGQWTLSTEESARPLEANITTGGTLRLEATLDNRTGLLNNSPSFSNSALFNLPWKRTTIAQMGAFDADGDSLVYSLDQPLRGCGMYETYAAYPAASCVPVILSTNPPCILNCPPTGPANTYSATLPIYVRNDTVGTCPNKTVVPRFNFDPISGTMVVDPARYDSVSQSAAGTNKYVVVVKVSEYRRINGTYVNIGSVRRDLMFTVFNCGTNILPLMGNTVAVQQGTAASAVRPLAQIIPVLSGEPINVLLTATDTNPGQVLIFDLTHNAVPGVQIVNTGPGAARLTFTPPLNLRNGIYRVNVNVTDNACPIRGFETRSLAFRVYGSALASHSGKAAPAIAAVPTPFTDIVEFQLGKAGVQTLTIVDNLGRLVATVRSQADGLVRWAPAAELPAGLYLAHSADGQQTVRLLRVE